MWFHHLLEQIKFPAARSGRPEHMKKKTKRKEMTITNVITITELKDLLNVYAN